MSKLTRLPNCPICNASMGLVYDYGYEGKIIKKRCRRCRNVLVGKARGRSEAENSTPPGGGISEPG